MKKDLLYRLKKKDFHRDIYMIKRVNFLFCSTSAAYLPAVTDLPLQDDSVVFFPGTC